MLEDGAFTEIVSWGFTGDTFVVKVSFLSNSRSILPFKLVLSITQDMNSFTRSILPLHFKHSNFASFVRQLNKYDFHKVKNPEEGTSPYGEHVGHTFIDQFAFYALADVNPSEDMGI